MKASYKIADTLNSLGSLREKQSRYKEAQEYYDKSLRVRQLVTPTSPPTFPTQSRLSCDILPYAFIARVTCLDVIRYVLFVMLRHVVAN